MRKMMTWFVTLVGVLGLSVPAHADFKLVQKNHTGSMKVMGHEQPARDVESTIWIGDGMLRMDEGENSFIVRLDQKKIYMVNHSEKKVTEVDLPLDVSKMLPPQMQEMMKMKASVTRTDETKKIGKWNATKYLITISSAMVKTEQVAWVTTDVPFDASKYAAMALEILKVQPGMESVAQEMSKIKGLVVMQDGKTTVMGATADSHQEVLSVEKTGPPEGGYEPPAGYQREPFDPMKMMQRKK